MGITWGANTVHTFGSIPAAPAPPVGSSSAFGTPAPAPFGSPAPSSGLFGGSSFGSSPAPPAPLFGSSPAPSTGLFGSPAPSAPTGLFGSSTFGAPSPAAASVGLFGSTNPSRGLFGSSFAPPQFPPQQQPQQQPQMIPAQAALQAHMNAEARQEEARVTSALTKFYQDYSGSTVADKQESAPFVLVHYTDATPEIRQQQWVQGSVINQAPRPVVPPRPLQVSEDDWNRAAARNPDFSCYMPSAIVGAEALQSRLSYQQEAANRASQQLHQLRETVQLLQQLDASKQVHVSKERNQQQRQRLVQLMRKVELVRCFHQPLQSQEIQTFQQLNQVHHHVEQRLKPLVRTLHDHSQQLVAAQQLHTQQRHYIHTPTTTTSEEDEQHQLEQVLRDQGEGVVKLQTALKRQVRDLKLIQQRIATTTTVAVPSLRRKMG